MHLRHLHLPNLTPYPLLTTIQDHLVQRLLQSKAQSSSPSSSSSPSPSSQSSQSSSASPPQSTSLPAPPPPTLLTFTPPPTYTHGRRQTPHDTAQPSTLSRILGPSAGASYHHTPRGGLTTYHGPGQLVAHLVLDLRRHHLSPRAYVHDVLEEAVIRVLRGCGLHGVGRHPGGHAGVWIGGEASATTGSGAGKGETSGTGKGETSEASERKKKRKKGEHRKIASVGVHLRRNVSSHGVAVNVDTDLRWFESIEACGLPGVEATSMQREGVAGARVEDVAGRLAAELAGLLEGVEGVRRVGVLELEVGFRLGLDWKGEWVALRGRGRGRGGEG